MNTQGSKSAGQNYFSGDSFGAKKQALKNAGVTQGTSKPPMPPKNHKKLFNNNSNLREGS